MGKQKPVLTGKNRRELSGLGDGLYLIRVKVMWFRRLPRLMKNDIQKICTFLCISIKKMENKYWTLQPDAQVEMLKKDVYVACNLF